MDRFRINDLDETIHGRVRLGAMVYLSAAGTAEFGVLKRRLEVTDGNLSVHLRKLEEAGYVAIDKAFAGRRPVTRARLTNAGRSAFIAYLGAIGRLMAEVGG